MSRPRVVVGSRGIKALGLILLLSGAGTARAQHSHGSSGRGHAPSVVQVNHRPGGPSGGSFGNSYGGYGSGYGSSSLLGYGGIPYFYAPPVFVGGPLVYAPQYYTPQPVLVGPVGGGLMLPTPAGQVVPSTTARPKSRGDVAKAEGLVTVGDNLFRAGNYRRAELRYEQAIKINPAAALPRARLAQVALVRGEYKEAAEQLRAAITAEPGWLINAKDIQSLYAEPADFSKALAKLETHLQGNPTDRDGWLVLGAEWYLSGKVRQSADVFTRLNDRKPDQTLAAFLDATTPDAPTR